MGSNLSGLWGNPQQCLKRAYQELRLIFGEKTTVSSFFVTEPVGIVRQSRFLNAVVRIEARVVPAKLLRILKDLEKKSGRQASAGTRWGPRTLDLDIIDHGRRVRGWYAPNSHLRPSRLPQNLILPHPQAHARAFVLVPLLEVAPHWIHPALHISGRRLLLRLLDRRGVVRA